MFGDGTGPVVTDHGGEGRHQHQAAIQQPLNAFGVGFESLDAKTAEAGGCPTQQGNALEHVVGDQGLEHIELEVALAGPELHGGVVAHHLGRHHREAFALGGIHLARHDRRARLVFRDHQFPEPAPGPAAEPAHVIGDFHQRTGQHGEGAMGGR